MDHPITIRTRIATGRIQGRTSAQPTPILASGIRDTGPILVPLVTATAGAVIDISDDRHGQCADFLASISPTSMSWFSRPSKSFAC